MVGWRFCCRAVSVIYHLAAGTFMGVAGRRPRQFLRRAARPFGIWVDYIGSRSAACFRLAAFAAARSGRGLGMVVAGSNAARQHGGAHRRASRRNEFVSIAAGGLVDRVAAAVEKNAWYVPSVGPNARPSGCGVSVDARAARRGGPSEDG